MKKGIIFDLDGTLWDSRETVAKAWNEAITQNSGRKAELDAKALGSLFGKPMMDIFDCVFPDCEAGERRRLAELCCKYENERLLREPGVLYEGVEETLDKLSADFPLFIVSNCQAGYIPVFLKSTGLGKYFRDSLCPDDTGKLKADNIRIIMERNGLEDAVYVGDTQGDADACKKAGVPMIFADYGLGEAKGCAGTIHSFPELLESKEIYFR